VLTFSGRGSVSGELKLGDEMIESFKPLLGACVAVVAALGGASAVAQQRLYTFDENGHGMVKLDTGAVLPVVTFVGADPGPGGLASRLSYFPGPHLTDGDLVLLEGGAVTDVIRFNDYQTGGNLNYPASVVFYSGADDGVDSLTDGGFPTAFWTNVVRVDETGPEGHNGILYHPAFGQPGFMPNEDATYRLFSDGAAVPEPAAWATLLIGLGALGALARRRAPA
jgi:hypothetical protein